MDKLIRITKNITFNDLRTGRKSPIDVYAEQIDSWLFRPLRQLSEDKQTTFENGYAMFGIELLFFEPHGKYLSGNTITASGKCFRFGFDPFLKFLKQNSLIDKKTLGKIRSKNFYEISRCGIFHDMTIKSGLLIDSIHMGGAKVFYESPINNGILVSPWNFLDAQKKYFDSYIQELRKDTTTDKYKKFETTFKTLFQY
ncbi:hypothetical protein [Flavobacterium lindanitolerans]|uniref:hypothetical protein n=1 Tax=Flavobacterium lindanitolerans TaxID=428988 RepID=UPI0027B9FF22|nr:hypothetical protein [Flavobacterium lindanitolerans]